MTAMYYPDLSPYPYAKWPAMLAVGWLDIEHRYSQGEVPPEFISHLAAFCVNPPVCALGIHKCEFCPSGATSPIARSDEQANSLGSCMIWAFGEGDIVYNAPDLIYHYVTVHQYQPPAEFIAAVMNGLQANTPAYQARYRQIRQGKASG
jgi:hypothetical protein